MSSFTTTFYQDLITATPTLVNGENVGIRLFRVSPKFANNDARFAGVVTVADLLATPAWVEAAGTGYPLGNQITLSLRSEGDNRYALFSGFPLTGMGQAEVTAAAFYHVGDLGGRTNPIIMVTDTMTPERKVLMDGDSIAAYPDTTLIGANIWLFSWAIPTAPAKAVMIGGPLAVSEGPPPFETAHTQHVYLFPQRANMIANPSFEAQNANFWSSNGAGATLITHVSGGAPEGGAWAGQVTAANPILESNVFPTNREEYWTIQFMAKGTGIVKVGFVWWTDEATEVAVDWGDDEWPVSPDAWTHIAVTRNPVQTYQGMLRIECQPGPLTIDKVLVEKGYLKDWMYFDGGTRYGARGDFSWYGGEARQGQTYSLWYNNKNAVYGRLFARNIDESSPVTDEELNEQGIVYKWVPAGTAVMAHIDVLYEHDLQAPIPTKLAGVIPYRTGANELDRIQSPWV